MNTNTQVCIDLNGESIDIAALNLQERALIGLLQNRFKSHPDWNDFDNFWMVEVTKFYQPQGLTRQQIRQTAGYRIAQDLSSRLAISGGYARLPDYRDELDDLIRSRFKTRREFCQATGLTEDMLSHVLAKRKQLGIDTLATALSKIGYELKIVPIQRQPEAEPTSVE